MELLILLPALLLLLGVSVLVVNQIVSFFQYRRSSSRRRTDRRVIDQVMRTMQLAQSQLARRGRELAEASRKLGANNAELARLNTMKTKFLSMAVHDVRTPLSTAKGFAQLLGMTPGLGDKERKYIDYIRRATDQINSLMSDLTDLAVIESGKFRLRPESLELKSFLDEIVPGIAFVATGKGVNFSLTEVPGNPAFPGDRQRLTRVLTNLLGNAVKFTPAGGRVELSVRAAAGMLLFSVKDTGPGIHPDERKRIFEKFYQSRFMKENARAAGWGLGLAIAEEIVLAHGGQIGVDSPGLGRGSTFWVRIPAVARRPAHVLRAGAAAVLFALAGIAASAGPALAQQLPLEEKARFEQSLERKANGVLLRLLGPNRYKVVVEATVDFTHIESFEPKDPAPAARSAAAGSYLWGGAVEDLLPGIPASDVLDEPAAAPAGPSSYERRNSYPSEFLKRLEVTVVVDKNVDVATMDNIRTIISGILGITPARGDELSVVSSTFVPAWKTLWYEPETASLILKYALISLLSLLTLLVVAVCLLRLSGAMSEMAGAQTQQLTMEMRDNHDGPLLPGPEDPSRPPESGAAGVAGASAAQAVRFSVRLDQIEALSGMLMKEDPANIALICAHLEPSVRTLLLERLPAQTSGEVLVNMGRPRFVEPEMIASLKEEIEHRLAGTVGGIERLAEMLEEADLSERSRLLDVVTQSDPPLAARLRERVFLIENLAELSPEEWSLLLSRLTNEEWALALDGAPAAVIDALQRAAGPGQWRVLEQLIGSSGKDPEARRAAQGRLAQEERHLKSQGRPAGGPLELTDAADTRGRVDVL